MILGYIALRWASLGDTAVGPVLDTFLRVAYLSVSVCVSYLHGCKLFSVNKSVKLMSDSCLDANLCCMQNELGEGFHLEFAFLFEY